ncbi:rod shape-determining protein MreC [Candidatus Falkowbacteria bacterium CG_4_10_14_0_2_um_filter_41_15]|uniref:Cell shape-determining protein MreC n=3 Tax=Candidatus Falkowiibacteriota TaxID=1752728 RepID=A0A2G9ZQG9_9BACT|nr:MAG: rod shape-determining protein MreC [Candidatus Falkowbacteria bacterium CG1_02_41_21]PIP34588.1 MAG: rod shape-determining protein MreC [Candidatus Falkowbacteria bacterium CG23_combo_of_CG06-09_8_20_14_all_41_10]PJA09335.1 MAG: rod shape-determining protein MreC [Candidatus Falkowbacteria bacterium CG_4_10_14_0_2_um_filter_41_15]
MFKNRIKPHIKIIVVAGLLIFLHFIGVLSPLERLTVKVSQPIFNKLYSLGSDWRKDYNQKNSQVDLNAKVNDLENELGTLVVANARLKDLENENQKLREYLNFFSQQQMNYILAKVTSQENFLDSVKYGQNIIINQGSVNNLIPGLVVINGQGVVVGKVLEVKENSARVCLLINNSCKLVVSILNQNRTIGVTEGNLGLTVKINFVGQTEKINQGDIVVTSGLEKDIPAGLVLGRVSQINNNENDVWQNINVEPLVNFDNLGIVSVVLP